MIRTVVEPLVSIHGLKPLDPPAVVGFGDVEISLRIHRYRMAVSEVADLMAGAAE